mmetsp:Transcript_46567/g.74079  ORF Transcript_46567/g.74079 Transcript_46567/m.74079 type:complete len:106 (-) Transcript_46567:248-565(-)
MTRLAKWGRSHTRPKLGELLPDRVPFPRSQSQALQKQPLVARILLLSTRNPRLEKTRRKHQLKKLTCCNPRFPHSLHHNPPQVDFDCKALVNLTNFPCEYIGFIA